jgi:hypothetical protein
MPPAKREELAPTMRAFMDNAVTTYGGKIKFGGASTFLKVVEMEILPGVAMHYRAPTTSLRARASCPITFVKKNYGRRSTRSCARACC